MWARDPWSAQDMSTYHNLCSPALVSASDSKGNVEPRPKVRNLISLRAHEVRRALGSRSPRSPLTEWSEKLSSKSIQTKHLRLCLFWFGLARPPGRFYCFFLSNIAGIAIAVPCHNSWWGYNLNMSDLISQEYRSHCQQQTEPTISFQKLLNRKLSIPSLDAILRNVCVLDISSTYGSSCCIYIWL